MKGQARILISVIVPAWNYGHFLARAIDSVLAQLNAQSELIVINDGSTDDTPLILASYESKYLANFRVIHTENKGAAAARNLGVTLARGSHLLMLDADDELMSDAIDLLTDLVKQHLTVDVALGGHLSCSETGLCKYRAPGVVGRTPERRIVDYLLNNKLEMSHGCNLFRRELLLDSPYPEELRSQEDLPVFASLLLASHFVRVNKPIAKIYHHSKSLRHNAILTSSEADRVSYAVLDRLPQRFSSLVPQYRAKRRLSLFRLATKIGEDKKARTLYWEAFYIAPKQALKWRYFRKALLMHVRLFKGRFSL